MEHIFSIRSKNKIDISEKNFNRWLNDIDSVTNDGTKFHNIISKITCQSEILNVLKAFIHKGKLLIFKGKIQSKLSQYLTIKLKIFWSKISGIQWER